MAEPHTSLFHLPDIALAGKAGAGKSSIAELLEGIGYQRLSFAGPLKVGAGTTQDRGKLQQVGQVVRTLVPDFWVNLLLAELDEAKTRGPVVIDDVRYPNELHALRAEGFRVAWVMAPESERRERLRRNGKLQDESQLEHESETALDPVHEKHYDDVMVWNGDAKRHLLGPLVDSMLKRWTR